MAPFEVLYLSHPEVEIDPGVPTPQWRLSPVGRARMAAFAASGAVPAEARIVASTERKAVDGAEILAAALGTGFATDPRLGENDRSATGYLPPEDFERHVAALFARPDESVAGWETARAAQSRVVAAVTDILAGHPPGRPLVLVGHGCVGTLLKCHVAGRPIAQAEDQRETAHPGGGNGFAFDLAMRTLLCDWTRMERFGAAA